MSIRISGIPADSIFNPNWVYNHRYVPVLIFTLISVTRPPLSRLDKIYHDTNLVLSYFIIILFYSQMFTVIWLKMEWKFPFSFDGSF